MEDVFVYSAKRLERGKFIWPQAKDGSVFLTAVQLSMLVEGIDWPLTEIELLPV